MISVYKHQVMNKVYLIIFTWLIIIALINAKCKMYLSPTKTSKTEGYSSKEEVISVGSWYIVSTYVAISIKGTSICIIFFQFKPIYSKILL